MRKKIGYFVLLILVIAFLPAAALAQTYSFTLNKMVVDAFWQEDGTLSVEYSLTFTNSSFADPLDVVDVGLPNNTYSLNNVKADVDGIPLTQIENSPYVLGVAVYLGEHSIPAGQSGTLHVVVDGIKQVLHEDSDDKEYVSAVFKTTWFDQKYTSGNTHTIVRFHLPAAVEPEEPRWHKTSGGFPAEPFANFDEQGRITYTWENPSANPYEGYTFGASFPAKYVPVESITKPDALEPLYTAIGLCLPIAPCLVILAIFAITIYINARAAQKRAMNYLPPSISIEGHGIKRGLTSVEAAVLLEQPMEKILTMILFSVLKKGAAEVINKDPLEIKVSSPLPEGLYPYEEDFLKAFSETKNKQQQRLALREMMVNLVKSLAVKMKGFSRKETVEYYRSILKKAWQQVEEAQTPEVKSEKYEENMDWAMLDERFDQRTKEVFRSEPIFLPNWWWRYDPTFRRLSTMHTASPIPASAPSMPQGRVSMPTLPGGEFAASVVSGMQNMAGSVVGNITDFTNSITNVTNPQPKTSSSSWKRSGGGGCACACACACAGCACACAGGGR